MATGRLRPPAGQALVSASGQPSIAWAQFLQDIADFLDGQDTRFGAVEFRTAGLEARASALEAHADALQDTVESHEATLALINDALSFLRNEIDAIKARLTAAGIP